MSTVPPTPKGQSVPSAPLAEHRNWTPFPSQYFQNVDTHDRVFHIVVTRVTYDLAASAPGEPLRFADEQAPLVTADAHYGEPGYSSVRFESDFAPYKPRCDVIVANANAYAPHGEPTRRWPCGIAVGTHALAVNVTGSRVFRRQMFGIYSLSQPRRALSVPLRYELAFGGRNVLHDATEEALVRQHNLSRDLLRTVHEEHYPPNPVGCGYATGKYLLGCALDERPAPQIEVLGKAYTGESDYPVAGLGVIGRHWQPRIALAGTYDARWQAERWPLLPSDFDFAYWNGAALQMPYPQGGERIKLKNLTPEGERTWTMPPQRLYTLVRLTDGPLITKPTPLDTLVFDLGAMKLYASYRVCVPADVHVRVLETRLRTRSV